MSELKRGRGGAVRCGRGLSWCLCGPPDRPRQASSHQRQPEAGQRQEGEIAPDRPAAQAVEPGQEGGEEDEVEDQENALHAPESSGLGDG